MLLIMQHVIYPFSYLHPLIGGIAGSVGKTITAPLSRLTILYQVNNALPPSQRISILGSSDSMLSLTSHILKTEGFSALWKVHYYNHYFHHNNYLKNQIIAFIKGNLTSVIHRFPYSAINFATYEICQSVLKSTRFDVETPSSRYSNRADIIYILTTHLIKPAPFFPFIFYSFIYLFIISFSILNQIFMWSCRWWLCLLCGLSFRFNKN